jgi:hypothetical protein
VARRLIGRIGVCVALLAAAPYPLLPAAAEPAGDRAEAPETAPPADLTGWRLCPACERPNPPDAYYCIYCGADLAKKPPESWRRTPFTISCEAPFSTNVGWFIGGVGGAYDGGVWSEEFILTPFYYFIIPIGGFNDLHFYLRQAELRPFFSVVGGGYDFPEFEGGGADDFFWTAGGAGGVRYNYDGRGSYLFGSGGLGYRRRGGESYEALDGPVLIFKTRFTHFFHEHIGFTGLLQGWNADIIASGGIVFAI